MQNAKQLEAQMRYQLFGRKATRIERQPGLQVVLSVREKWGGPVKRFEVQTSTISRLEAQILAEREARKQGKTPHALVDIGTGIFEADASPYVVKA
jgi:hypothetical protein